MSDNILSNYKPVSIKDVDLVDDYIMEISYGLVDIYGTPRSRIVIKCDKGPKYKIFGSMAEELHDALCDNNNRVKVLIKKVQETDEDGKDTGKTYMNLLSISL